MKRTRVLTILATLTAIVAAVVAGLTWSDGRTSVSTGGPGPTVTTIPPTTTTTTAPPTTTVPPTTTTTAPPTTTTTAPPTTTTPPTTAPPTTAPPDTGTLRPGDSGPQVRALQEELVRLGYWLGTVDGAYGRLTTQAVLAFQKVEGLTRDGLAGDAVRSALATATRPSSRGGSGDRIEVDKARQVLLVVRNGRVEWALNTSTGTEQTYVVDGRTAVADTPPGHWTVSWVVDGNDPGPLGVLYRPRYFHGDGIAVHGYHSVPAYPASHGCVRVTEPAMDWIWANDLMPMGSEVWVY